MVERGRRSWLEEQVENAEANFSSGGCREYWVDQIRDALTRNEVRPSSVADGESLAGCSRVVYESLRATVFTCIRGEIGIGIGEGGKYPTWKG